MLDVYECIYGAMYHTSNSISIEFSSFLLMIRCLWYVVGCVDAQGLKFRMIKHQWLILIMSSWDELSYIISKNKFRFSWLDQKIQIHNFGAKNHDLRISTTLLNFRIRIYHWLDLKITHPDPATCKKGKFKIQFFSLRHLPLPNPFILVSICNVSKFHLNFFASHSKWNENQSIAHFTFMPFIDIVAVQQRRKFLFISAMYWRQFDGVKKRVENYTYSHTVINYGLSISRIINHRQVLSDMFVDASPPT
jgi:hypothetical protein